MILTDTGPIVAILDADDAHHDLCVNLLPLLKGPMLTTTPCFVDASVVVAAETLGTTRVLTLDRHFRAYLIHGNTPFEILP